ncbi:hypothetical protein T439DRAFT_322649 [Meredithblackwellia eburnea MCA 4105]
MSQNRWTSRKAAGGQFTARAELSTSQLILLSAVPAWKREWVRPAGLKPHQSPGLMVRKWVIDTTSERQEGTEEEMAAAMEVVARGDVGLEPTTEGNTPLPASGFASGSATPAVPLEASRETIELGSKRAQQLVAEAFPADSISTTGSVTPAAVDSPLPTQMPVVANPAKPAAGPAASPDPSLPPAHDAVADLNDSPAPPPADDDPELQAEETADVDLDEAPEPLPILALPPDPSVVPGIEGPPMGDVEMDEGDEGDQEEDLQDPLALTGADGVDFGDGGLEQLVPLPIMPDVGAIDDLVVPAEDPPAEA